MEKKITIKECEYCEQLFTADRKDKRYCSHSCRQQAYIKRKAVALDNKSQQIIIQNTVIIKRKDGLIKRFLRFLW